MLFTSDGWFLKTETSIWLNYYEDEPPQKCQLARRDRRNNTLVQKPLVSQLFLSNPFSALSSHLHTCMPLAPAPLDLSISQVIGEFQAMNRPTALQVLLYSTSLLQFSFIIITNIMASFNSFPTTIQTSAAELDEATIYLIPLARGKRNHRTTLCSPQNLCTPLGRDNSTRFQSRRTCRSNRSHLVTLSLYFISRCTI